VTLLEKAAVLGIILLVVCEVVIIVYALRADRQVPERHNEEDSVGALHQQRLL
jgi:hypothetical protein